MTSEVIKGHKTSPFIYEKLIKFYHKPDPSPMGSSLNAYLSKLCGSLSLSRSLIPSLSITLYISSFFLFCSMHTDKCFLRRNFFIKWSMILKVTWSYFLLCVIFKKLSDLLILTYVLMDYFLSLFSYALPTELFLSHYQMTNYKDSYIIWRIQLILIRHIWV